ncbi:hypothetical protein EVAR_11399_1 [Eumeta japonica]|uniref:Uncharacterized protein n=1 Tax=Eumeta variegata TaxID=151549 RepID=A0A4C1TKQ7_EUMVA|nr:hypothetical protein EVAR_11399_1 [Eumeta japonica]
MSTHCSYDHWKLGRLCELTQICLLQKVANVRRVELLIRPQAGRGRPWSAAAADRETFYYLIKTRIILCRNRYEIHQGLVTPVCRCLRVKPQTETEHWREPSYTSVDVVWVDFYDGLVMNSRRGRRRRARRPRRNKHSTRARIPYLPTPAPGTACVIRTRE